MIVDGWVDWAQQVPGMRQDKRYPQPNIGAGIVWHSQEGGGLTSMVNIHQSDAPPSFMFWLSLLGHLYQFSPVTASVWCSGSLQANTLYWPVEAEGTSVMPLNDDQIGTALRLVGEWERHTGNEATRPGTMLEHREVATRWAPNAGPTACPSERYAPLWAAMEDAMTPEQLARLERLERLAGGFGVDTLDGQRLTGVPALAYLDELGISTPLTFQAQNAALGEHVDNHPGPAGPPVPPHTHTGEVTVQ